MTPGDVVLAALPQADGQRKLRPALLLCQLPPFGDCLTCGISSQHRHHVEGFDELIAELEPVVPESGLQGTSLVRLGFVGMLVAPDIAGTVGRVAPERLQRLRRNLAQHLVSDSAK